MRAEPTQLDPGLLVDVESAEARDRSTVGVVASSLAAAASNGARVTPTAILTPLAVEQLRTSAASSGRWLFGRSGSDEPGVADAVRAVWRTIGRGGLTDVSIRRSNASPMIAAPVCATWTDLIDTLVRMVLEDAERGETSPIVLQPVMSVLVPLLAERSVAEPGDLRLCLADDERAGSMTIGSDGSSKDEGAFADRHHPFLGIGERGRLRTFHEEIAAVFAAADEPARVVILVDEAGLRSLSAIELV